VQILLSEIRFVLWPNHIVICFNMRGCLIKPEMVAGVTQVGVSGFSKKDGCGNIHFSTNLI